MKKKIIWSLMAVLAVAAIYNYSNTKNDLVALNNIEVLAFASAESYTGETGPKIRNDCPGYFAGTYAQCQNENTIECESTSCFN